MEIELIEVCEFLGRTAPFDRLPPATLATLPAACRIRYLRRGTPFPPEDADGSFLYVVRSGAIELRDGDGQLTEKLAAGSVHSAACQLVAFDPGGSGKAAEDSLLYLLPCAVLQRLCREFTACAEFFGDTLRQRMQRALVASRAQGEADLARLTAPVRHLLRRPPVCIEQAQNIRAAANCMATHGISSVLVTHQGKLAGVVTDRDLRNRCLAAGLSPEQPVATIMTRDVHTVGPETLVVDALNHMTRLQVSHLPVVDQGELLGVVSIGALVRHQNANTAFLTLDIQHADSVERLAQVASRLPELQEQLADARHLGEAVSTVTDSLTRRLLHLGEERLGPPPVPYAWLAGGSQARREQSSHSDQDNALLLADTFQPAHTEYFADLARWVCAGLAACGFPHCPGDSMASNPQWCQPLAVWRRYFATWIGAPEPRAPMLASIFFDLRAVAGDTALFDTLHRKILEQSRANALFIAHLAADALRHRPPLGFFRTLVLIRDGEHAATFDIKHQGIVPITDIARVLALSLGVPAVNTAERLRAARRAGAVHRTLGENLEDALEYLANLRIRHQTAQLRRGQPADNFLPPAQLSQLEREHLKAAFKVIQTTQEWFASRYQTGQLG